MPDPTQALHNLTDAFLHERDLLVRARRMDRIVKALDSGEVTVEEATEVPVVPYLIFEIASADVRRHLNALEQFDIAWALRSIHNIAVGLRQLHGGDIAHQDVKPSNVLVFEAEGLKIADLGRASLLGKAVYYDRAAFPGDPVYQPAEFLYGHREEDWIRRRFGTDLYMLGSMVVFFFMQTGMTALLFAELEDCHQPESWGSTYREVLPYVRDAMGRVVGRFEDAVRCELNDDLARELARIVRELCEPDPSLRGDARVRRLKNPCDLERYITRFDVLARKAEMEMYLRARS